MPKYYYLDKKIFDIIEKNLKVKYDCVKLLDDTKIFSIPIETYKNEYFKMISEFPEYNDIKKIEGVPENKLKITIAFFFCKYITENIIKSRNNSQENLLIIPHKNFNNIEKITLPTLKKHFSLINEKYTIKNYDKIITSLTGTKLRAKIISIIEEYVSKGLVQYTPEKSTSTITTTTTVPTVPIIPVVKESKIERQVSPKKKPLTPLDDIREEQILIRVKKADSNYINKIKKELAALESNEYSIEALKKDINDDKFIIKAIDGHIKALEFKFKSYEKLKKIDWMGIGKEQPSKGEVNLNEIIKDMQQNVIQKIKQIKENPNKISEKRNELLNIINDPDNGIISVKGKSRENLRISLIKIIYMFIEVPIFFFKGFNNFVLTGPAGSGKTKVAGVIAYLMNNLGILVTTNVIMATKQNLVGQYIGQSGPKTRNLLSNGLEGVVFIDEAYTLTPCDKSEAKNDNYTQEVIGELINFMDKFMGCIIIIVAGYKDKMTDCFLTYNEGLSRRFPKMIELSPYSSNDLYNIFELFLNDTIDVKEILSLEKRKFIKSIIATLNQNNIFNNQAGDMLNLSKVIGEDAVLNNKKYDKNLIKISFKKFCLGKDIAIEF